MYLTPTDNHWICDIEADSLEPTIIWCIVLTQVQSGLRVVFDPSNLDRFGDWVRAHPDVIFVGHNFLSFDAPNIERLLGVRIPLSRCVDTLVLSYLYNPRMPGGHSLAAWGERLGAPKIHFDDFSHFSEVMLEYCIQDTDTNRVLYRRLTKRMRDVGFSERSCRLEHEIRVVVDKQQRNGFYFDRPEAEALQSKLRVLQDGLGQSIHELFPPELVQQGSYKFRTKADGSPYATYVGHLEKYPKLELTKGGSEYEVYDWQEFNIASPPQRINKLISLGWKPIKFTKKTAKGGGGNPQVDEESLLAFSEQSGIPEVKAIAEWLVLQGRASMIETWLNNLGQDSRIHGWVNSCGAGTRRMTHNSPNTANIPKAKAKVPWGKECRQLWTVADHTRELMGYDAKGLEGRVMAHYLGEEEATRLFVDGDPHLHNTRLLGLPDEMRDLTVKNGWYAMVYGAQDGTLGSTINLSLTGKAAKEYGKWARAIWEVGVPGLKRFVNEMKSEMANGGWIETIDGGYVRCLSDHAAVNYKCQSAGGIVMKQASIFLDRRTEGMDVMKVADIHDEAQFDCAVGLGEECGKLAVQAIKDAGEELNFKVPLDGTYSIGRSWADTH